MKTAYFSHPDFRLHETEAHHPERSARMNAIETALHKSEVWKQVQHCDFQTATPKELMLCHTSDLIERIETLALRGGGFIDADTHVGSTSFEGASLAAGAAISAVEMVINEQADNAFVTVRPPGHHAESRRAMGFCLFNSVAVAARCAQVSRGVERVAILDWDVHHGNGTQEIFYRDGSVFFASVHQSPLYPYSGSHDERGAGDGQGLNYNFPLPSGQGDADYERIWRSLEEPLRAFQPQLILISAGFDAHMRDPLGGMNVTADGFARLMQITKEWAAEMCQNRVVAVLEGGYDLVGLSESVVAVVTEMTRDD